MQETKEVLTLTQKIIALKGKRYKVISEPIEKRRSEGENIPFEMEIDLHYCWMLTIQNVRKSTGL